MIAGTAPVAAIRTIAVSSTVLPWGRAGDTSLQRQFDSAFIAALRLAGYRVIPPAKVDPVWHALSDTAQLYDLRTGQVNPEQYSAVVRAMSRTVKEKFNADAWLIADFTIREARYSDGWCDWDGAKQYVQSGSQLDKDVSVFRASTGTMRAVSVRVVVNDPTGREIYRNYGGVAPLASAALGGIVDLRAGEALTSFERNTNAVRLVLMPLMSSFP